MKRVICIFVCLGILLATATTYSYAKTNESQVVKNEDLNIQASIEKKLIRFHVIANSDSAADQALKLKVRDKVLEYISPKLKQSKSIDESRNIIKNNDEAIKRIAQDVISKNGYKYDVVTMLSKEKFPVKTYGNITLPQGEYEAYRIIIGTGKGQNWWCVMFPPLCFVDITKGEVSYKETEKTMKQVLTEKEFNEVDNTKPVQQKEESEKIIVKFKIVELFHKLFKKA